MTSADGAEEFYTLANNTARTETPQEARKQDTRLKECWLGTRPPKICSMANLVSLSTTLSELDSLSLANDVYLFYEKG